MAILVPFKWSSEDSGGNPNLMISHSRDFPFSERGHSKLSPESPVEFSEYSGFSPVGKSPIFDGNSGLSAGDVIKMLRRAVPDEVKAVGKNWIRGQIRSEYDDAAGLTSHETTSAPTLRYIGYLDLARVDSATGCTSR